MILRGLTLWRPWAASIVHGPKRVENRPWAPPARMLAEGLWIAIHAGRTWDREGAAFVRNLWPEARATVPHGTEEGIVGIARVVDALTFEEGDRDGLWGRGSGGPDPKDPWSFGPYVWRLEHVRALNEPIPCRGAQGLWRLPVEIAEVLEALCGGAP